MDKNAIKKYAVWARTELIQRVSQRAAKYGIEKDNIIPANAESVNGQLLTADEKKQRVALIKKIDEDGYDQVMEEVAYTWFNRFAALRFMEVNGYLPTHVRVFTDENNAFKPEILTEAIHLDGNLDGIKMDKVYAFKDANKTEELFRYLLITQCNALNKILPGMFQKISDYTELLLPDNLLREGTVVEQMISIIPEDDWKDQVQIIGWLYESYNLERNALVYDGSFGKSKIPKEFLPAATTIFTPDWPVHYMVENSLGRLWYTCHPHSELKSKWKYYLDETPSERDTDERPIDVKKNVELKPEDIRCIDPCEGSGHILCVLFDTLVQIYEDYGYSARDAVGKIIENNIWGIDIDDRAAQLAYFSVMMKARQYDRRFFSRNIQPHIYAIIESNHLDDDCINYFINGNQSIKKSFESLVLDFTDAKEYGSIINVKQVDFALLFERFNEIRNEKNSNIYQAQVMEQLVPFVQMAQTLAQKYEVVVTNPPYLGNTRFSPKLDTYVKKNYENVKSDLSMVMYQHAINELSQRAGYVAFITTSSWMFLTSFEKMRDYLLKQTTFISLVDFGTELFDGKVGHNPIVAWVICNSRYKYKMKSVRLVDYCYARRNEKETEFFNEENRYYIDQRSLLKIPGHPITYWMSSSLLDDFNTGEVLAEYAIPKQGMSTCDVNKYTKFWYEVNITDTNIYSENNCAKWIKYNKGGSYRKWYGNREYVVYWNNNGETLYKNGAVLRNRDVYFNEFIAWTKISALGTGFRKFEPGFLFDGAGGSLFNQHKGISDEYLLGLLNSNVVAYILKFISPTLNFNENHIGSIPVIQNKNNHENEEITKIVNDAIFQSKMDWDSFETSWDFSRHPLARGNSIRKAYEKWEGECNARYNKLKADEEKLNDIFIRLYNLQYELHRELEEKNVTINKADASRDIKSFISYAVGCMFGRYSLDNKGLIYAGNNWDKDNYISYPVDDDNIIPISDDEYFKDDIVNRFTEFVSTVYGNENLEDNLHFIAGALDSNGNTSREIIRNYFLNDFFKDHCKIYQKRPIYWMFDSGKKNGFKCLIYVHRYQPDTIARIRTDYLHEIQARYHTAIVGIENQVKGVSTSDRIKLDKKLMKLKGQEEETRIYEEKIHHLADQMIPFDLDDGVKVNYAKLQTVLAKI